MEQLKISLFEPLQIRLNNEIISDFRMQKVVALLVYLAAEPETAHRRETLMTLLWPGMPDTSARANLRQVLFHLRKAIPDFVVDETAVPLLISNRHTIQLNMTDIVTIDTVQFESLLRQVQTHDHTDLLTCPTCHKNLVAATAIYTGRFLADFYLEDSNEFEEWAEITRQSYQRKVLDALEALTKIAIRQQAYADAHKHAERQLEIDDLRESAYQQLMEILARSGQRNEAMAVYERCRRHLKEELEMAPSKRTTDLYEQIFAGNLSLDSQPEQGVRGYELQDEIGAGAYGVIHRAMQPSVGREVAVKVIRRRYANDPSFIRRFEAEAQMIARLEHPHIVPLYDYWRDPDGAYLVMRLLRGGNLLTALANGPWSLDQTQNLLDQITPALAIAHSQGIIHRDIKPANILFDESNNAYLSDFGIAKDLDNDYQLTLDGGILGTPDYISPEQLQEESVTPQSDIYSLGAVLYEMLTGEKPFPDVPLVKIIQSHLSTPFPLVRDSRPDLSAQIDEVIQRATAKRPSDRFPDALTMAEAFRQSVAGRLDMPSVIENIIFDTEILNPYKGLRAFQEADAQDFYGRNQLVTQLIEHLGKSGFLAVVGPSGSGKSSVVKAGMIPALRQSAIHGSDKWFVAEMVPSTHPLEELEQALWPIAVDPPPGLVAPMQRDTSGMLRTIRRILPNEEGAQLLLVIDQFEELWSLTSETRRQHFLESLLVALSASQSPLHVVITLRADFYDRPLQYQPLAELFKQHTEVVLPMTQDGLMWAIQGPAQRAGVTIEDTVVTAIVAEVDQQPGALPLLQYALTEMFDARVGRQITRIVYDEMGGVLGALPRRADEIYDGLSPSEQLDTRQFFLRLITLGEGIEDTRRRVLLSEMEALDLDQKDTQNQTNQLPIRDIINKFGNARLLTFDHDPLTRQPTVEVAHEALLREWGYLRGWLDESRDDVRMQRLLATAVAEWQLSDKNPGYLLRGARLNQFEGWVTTTTVALTTDEQSFITGSIAERAQRQAEEAARQQRELETAQQLAETEHQRAEEQVVAAQNLRRRATYLGAALVVAAVLAIVALFAGVQANNNAATAVANANTAATQEALAIDEADQRATAQAQAEIESQRADVERDAAIDAQATAVAEGVRADEQLDVALVAEAEANEARLEAEEQAKIAFSRELAAEAVNNLGEEPERSVLLALQALKTTHTQESEEALHRALPNLRHLHTMAGHEDGFSDLAYSPDGSRLVSTNWDGTIRVWDSATGQELLLLSETEEEFLRERYRELAYSSDGSYFATGGDDGTARVWDAVTGELLTTFTGHRDIPRPNDPDSSNWIIGLDVSPDSKTIATSDRAGLVKLWDAATGAELKTLDLSETAPNHWSVQFSSDGLRLIVFGDDPNESDYTIRMIEIDSGSELFAIEGRFSSFALSPDGSRLIFSEAYENEVRLWDLDAKEEITRYATGEVDNVAFSPDGSLFATLARDLDTIQLWETETGAEVMAMPTSHGHVIDIVFSPDGASLATTGWDRLLKVWDINPDHERMTVQPFSETDSPLVTQIRFSQDGTMLAAGGVAGGVSLWDPVTGENVLTLEGHDDWVGGLGFSPDGDRLASGADDTLVKVWDTSTGELLLTLTGHEDWVNNIAYSPDGATIASIGNDGLSFVWDANTGEVLHQLPLRGEGWGIAYNPDSTLFATGSLWNPLDSENVTIWDVATGEAVRVIDNKEGADELLFSNDGSLLITGGVDGFVRIWEVATGQLLKEIAADNSVIYGASLSPDGTILATAAAGSDVRLWDLQSGERLLTLDGSEEGIALVEFTEDGEQIVTSGGQSGSVRFLVLSVDELINIAESRLTRTLSEEECQEYLHMDSCPAE